MPWVTLTLRERRPAVFKPAVRDAIHAALLSEVSGNRLGELEFRRRAANARPSRVRFVPWVGFISAWTTARR